MGGRCHKSTVQVGNTKLPTSKGGRWRKDEDEILESLIHANKQREKSNEQIAREAAELFKVEEVLAPKRKQSSQFKSGQKKNNPTVPVNLPGPSIPQENGTSSKKGDSRDVVGEKLGISGSQAIKAKVVIEKIDSLKKQGEEEAAEKLRTTLNKKSIHAAYKEATRRVAIRPRMQTPAAGPNRQGPSRAAA